MSKIENAIHELHRINSMQEGAGRLKEADPLLKFLVTIIYIITVVSFDNTDAVGELAMILYPLCMFIIGELSVGLCIKRIGYIIPFVCLVGIFNPPGSMVTLILKGIFTITAAYILIITTGIEDICAALARLHMPKIIVTLVLLIYRYITVLLEEVNRTVQAYSLRAPGQKGIAFRTWGPLTGQILLRSMDRASAVYESMCLRGCRGTFIYKNTVHMRLKDIALLAAFCGIMVLLRYVHVFEIVGDFII